KPMRGPKLNLGFLRVRLSKKGAAPSSGCLKPASMKTTFKLVANAQVHRQPAANLPVVLNVVRHLPGDAALFLGRADPPQGDKIGRRQRRRATGRRGTRNPGVIHAEEN